MFASGCRSRDEKQAAPPAPEKPASLTERIDDRLSRARDYLLAKQKDDGSWRSGAYAAFRDGYSLSPLILAALFAVPPSTSPDHAGAYARGVDYIATMVVDGKLRDDVDAPRYPQYSYALGILVLNRDGNERHHATRAVLVKGLRARQLDSGGWGYGEPGPGEPANLSATLFAVGALRLARIPADDPTLVRALAFVDRCRGADGGFAFSPDLPDGNKAGPAPGGGYRSYGSMTSDGARALVRLGLPLDDPRVAGARSWLEKHFDARRNPGDFPKIAEVRQHSSYYYYVWSVAHAMHALGVDKRRWAQPLAEELLTRQAADGSWKNGYSEMRENDPLVATAFAVAALAVARSAITGVYQSHGAKP